MRRRKAWRSFHLKGNEAISGFYGFAAVFLRGAGIGAAKDAGKVIRRMIADDLSNFADGEFCMEEILDRTRHADLFDELRKADAGILLDQCARDGALSSFKVSGDSLEFRTESAGLPAIPFELHC